MEEGKENSENQMDEEPQRQLRFRNYHPRDDKLKELMIPAPPDLLQPNIKRFEAQSRYDGDEVNISFTPSINFFQALLSTVPKTSNWDLKRDVEPKLTSLERQTQQAMIQLLKSQFKPESG